MLVFVTDRRTDGRKIIDGEIADRLMLVFVTDRWTDGWKIIEGEIADRLNQIHKYIHTQNANMIKDFLKIRNENHLFIR